MTNVTEIPKKKQQAGPAVHKEVVHFQQDIGENQKVNHVEKLDELLIVIKKQVNVKI